MQEDESSFTIFVFHVVQFEMKGCSLISSNQPELAASFRLELAPTLVRLVLHSHPRSADNVAMDLYLYIRGEDYEAVCQESGQTIWTCSKKIKIRYVEQIYNQPVT